MTRHRTLLTSLFLASFGFISLALPLTAHHASGPFYDSDKPIEIEGVVTRFVFRNPHAALFLDVTDESGATAEWQVELGAPVMLRRFGWTPDCSPSAWWFAWRDLPRGQRAQKVSWAENSLAQMAALF